MRVGKATARAVNGLTARWAAVAEGGTVFSAAGVWPLPAFLADGADGTDGGNGGARGELADALGLPADEAAGAARELLGGMVAIRGLDTAVGVWTRRTLELREAWAAGLPAGTRGVLTGDAAADRAALDAWAVDRTGGLIERMPVGLDRDPELVLAGAPAMRTRWLAPFEESPLETAYAPWAAVERLGLRRSGARLDRTGLADTPDGFVTEPKVPGDNALDVHLLLGEERMTPGQVLAAGVGILDGVHVTTVIDAAFDRPFGFLALHRHSRLVLAAGWVTDPLPFPEYPWEDDE